MRRGMKQLVLAVLGIVVIAGAAAVLIAGRNSKMVKGTPEAVSLSEDYEALIVQETFKERAVNTFNEARVKVWIERMTLEQKLAQMMILTSTSDITEANLSTYQPGGVIFFGADFEGKSISSVRARVDALQSYVNLPLLVGVDEEGGTVSRLRYLDEPDVPKFRGARELYSAGIDEVKSETKKKVEVLKELGINLNFNPVADTVADTESYMYDRSASGDPNEAGEYVETVVSVMNAGNMGTCIKHFPGYGNNVNTHDTFARDSRALSEYEEGDFIPFKKGIEAGTDMIMVSHIVMESVDSENPSSLSPEVHRIIRENLGYEGVILTDDLNMGAIQNDMTMTEATTKAFAAGNDMIFSADFAASLEGAKSAVASGAVSEEQINASVERILKMKLNRNLY